jgi:hypothetical protein
LRLQSLWVERFAVITLRLQMKTDSALALPVSLA